MKKRNLNTVYSKAKVMNNRSKIHQKNEDTVNSLMIYWRLILGWTVTKKFECSECMITKFEIDINCTNI